MTPPAYRLRPWTDVVRPHDDIVEGRLEMSTYAADVSAVDSGNENTPAVYRDPREFFRTTYPTESLRRLLSDVLTVLGGGPGDRVIQLRTPFGGGKTHSLLALYHLLKSRERIDAADVRDLPDPGRGRIAVLNGLELDPWSPREVDGLQIGTLWGELAFRLAGPAGYERVREQDERGAPPGNEILRPLFAGGPVLVLLDEVLVYVQRAGGKDGTHAFRRQVMNFLQGLTELVRGLPNAAMVYSLQASEHEAARDEELLSDLDHLVTRTDTKREPVSDEELMRVVQRRLFPTFGAVAEHDEVARQVAREYALAYRRLRETYAETDADRRAAGAEAERFEQRVLDSYPFHPELLDLMYHRWGSLPSYQRTRGALQFLARVTAAIWKGTRPPQALIGPGDVALEDEHVRGAFFSQVGERERYSSVLSADITGDEARAANVDRRIASDSPVFELARVGTRVATAIMLYSFGARQGEDRGVVESDLIQPLATPDLDRNVLTTALHDLREELLYLHHVGRRYRFEPKANLNLLIADERKKFEPHEVLDHVGSLVAEALREGGDSVVLWPADSKAIPDGETMFRVVYLGEEWLGLEGEDLEKRLAELVEREGSTPRAYPNSLGFALPGRVAFERARQAARTALALDSLIRRSKQHGLDDEQVDDLRERERGTKAELAGAVDRLYEQAIVPMAVREGDRAYGFDATDLRAQLVAGRGVHARVIDALRKHVFDRVTPARMVTLTRLGDDRRFVSCEELVKWFFSYYTFPKVRGEGVIREAVARGIGGAFGYIASADVRGDELVPRPRTSVWFGEALNPDEIDLGPDAYIIAADLAARMAKPSEETGEPLTGPEPVAAAPPATPPDDNDGHGSRFHLTAAMTAEQLFRILPALQNLAERSDRFLARLELEAEAHEPFDPNWLRNAVDEHLEEAGVDADRRVD